MPPTFLETLRSHWCRDFALACSGAGTPQGRSVLPGSRDCPQEESSIQAQEHIACIFGRVFAATCHYNCGITVMAYNCGMMKFGIGYVRKHCTEWDMSESVCGVLS
jgi:hypothetical protein